MELAGLAQNIHDSGVGDWMRSSLKAMPVVEAIHVFTATTVFGTVFIVDLRLLGIPDCKRSVTRVSDELLRLTWLAFAVATVSGALMFAANAQTYFINTAFRLKLLAILAAGINMLIFETLTRRDVAAWDVGVAPPRAARIAGLLSILLWITVIVLARWIGFTKGYDFAVPDDPNIKFDF
jgi:hypothetical protein